MRKILVALGALGLMAGVSAVTIDTAGKVGFSSAVAQKAKAKAKRVAKKAKVRKAKVARRCKRGERWNAAATANAGACEKVKAKRTAKRVRRALKRAPKA